MTDKWGRDYDTMLAKQRADLQRWQAVLTPEAFRTLEECCRRANRPVPPEELKARASLTTYKAGGLHLCPTGFELYTILFDRERFEEGLAQVARSSAAVITQAVKNKKTTIMKDIATKITEIANAFTELAEMFAALPAGGSSDSTEAGGDADPKAALIELAGKKDAKLVSKVLAKFGADSIEELGEDDIEKATTKIEALDDVEGGESEPAEEAEKPAKAAPKGGKITLDTLRELGQSLISDGKADALQAIVKKHGAPSLSKLDAKHYAAVHAKLSAL